MFSITFVVYQHSKPLALLLAFFVALFGQVHTQEDEFSQEDWAPASSWEAITDKGLLTEIEQALGSNYRRASDERLTKLVEGLLPVFQALPKNEYGKLGHASVRYLLHRFFVEKHGWFVEGLFTEGAAWNTSSPTDALQSIVPMIVQGFFEKRLGGRGFGLHEMAVLVSFVEDSIHAEAMGNLRKTYEVLGLQMDASLSQREATYVQHVYMTSLVLNLNLTETSKESLLEMRANIVSYYPTWPNAAKWMRTIRQEITQGDENFTFTPDDVGTMVRQTVDTWGLFHGSQCANLKKTLLTMEER